MELTEDRRLELKQAAVDLHNAADVMRRHGFGRGALIDHGTGRVCLLGALRIAVLGHVDVLTATPDEAARISRGERVLSVHLGTRPATWNDAVCDGGPEAVAALELAAAWCEQQAG